MENSTNAGLFLPGHKTYELEIKPAEPNNVYTKKYQCPFCLSPFEKDVPRQSNMRLVKTDPDLRQFHSGIETLYYEIITCPSCLISAVTPQFEKAKTAKEKKLFEILSPYKGAYDFSGKSVTDVNAMFAGFYLAVKCAPVCFPDSDMILARVWHRLSWLYGDCEDNDLAAVAGKNALDTYIKAYQNTDFPEEQEIRVNLIIAELSFRYGNVKTASEFFFKVKMNKKAAAMYQRLAEDRLEEIRRTPR